VVLAENAGGGNEVGWLIRAPALGVVAGSALACRGLNRRFSRREGSRTGVGQLIMQVYEREHVGELADPVGLSQWFVQNSVLSLAAGLG
jgi:hypothetical protein